jgi:predicted amidophosphoribosyltransferase
MALLDLVLPRRCLVCGAGGIELCERCHSLLPRLPPPFCQRCGSPTHWPVRRCAECAGRRLAFASARAAVIYDAQVRRLVAAWKERGQRTVAAIAADFVHAAVPRPDVAALVPVPADPARGIRRGHSPSRHLSRELGSRWELPVVEALRRDEGRPRQRGLPLGERRRNVAGAFHPTRGVEARIGLVDDVYTSGATAAAAAAALRKAGARSIEVVTFARAVR